VIHDCIVIKPLTEIPVDSDGESMESDAMMDDMDDDDDDGLEERMEGLLVHS